VVVARKKVVVARKKVVVARKKVVVAADPGTDLVRSSRDTEDTN
jgi:hypothetical protein